MSETVDMSEPEIALAEPRVILVDDHDLFRTGLRNLLSDEGVDVVGEAQTGAEALGLVRELAPDVVVMDLNMPGMGGVEATRQINVFAPLTRVLVLTISEQDDDMKGDQDQGEQADELVDVGGGRPTRQRQRVTVRQLQLRIAAVRCAARSSG